MNSKANQKRISLSHALLIPNENQTCFGYRIHAKHTLISSDSSLDVKIHTLTQKKLNKKQNEKLTALFDLRPNLMYA